MGTNAAEAAAPVEGREPGAGKADSSWGEPPRQQRLLETASSRYLALATDLQSCSDEQGLRSQLIAQAYPAPLRTPSVGGDGTDDGERVARPAARGSVGDQDEQQSKKHKVRRD